MAEFSDLPMTRTQETLHELYNAKYVVNTWKSMLMSLYMRAKACVTKFCLILQWPLLKRLMGNGLLAARITKQKLLLCSTHRR